MATLTAKERTDFTRSSLRNIRTSGHVPGIIYGKDTGNKPVSLDSVELIKTLRTKVKIQSSRLTSAEKNILSW